MPEWFPLPIMSPELAVVCIPITEDLGSVMSFNYQGNQSPGLWHLLLGDSEEAIGSLQRLALGSGGAVSSTLRKAW